MTLLSRRALLLGTAALPFATQALADARDLPLDRAQLGEVSEITGQGTLLRGDAVETLVPSTPLQEGDTVTTGQDGLALLLLDQRMRIQLGMGSVIELASFGAEGGQLNLDGAMVFDRPEDMAPLPLRFSTLAGEIAVTGTRFFAGLSRGEYAVFVQRGSVEVSNAGVTRVLAAGDGCSMAQGQAPGEVSAWGEARIVEAFASLGLTRD